MKTLDELKEELKNLKFRIFCEECADFLDWPLYHKLNKEKKELEKQIAELEG